MREQGLSYRALSLKAIDPDTGHRLGHQWLNKFGTLSKAPDPWQLRALAAALDVPAEVVKGLAARQWLQYEVAQVGLGSPHDWALYLQLKDLPEQDKATMRVIVREFIRRQEQKSEEAGEAPA